MFSIKDYDYFLPEELIAQNPADKRDESKLFCIKREDKSFEHLRFKNIIDKISENDLFVVNNTRVVPARLFGLKETGGRVEILILDYLSGLESYNKSGEFKCECLMRASRRPKAGSKIAITDDFYAQVLGFRDKYANILFVSTKQDVLKAIDAAGNLPLPPYIKREEGKTSESDNSRYQTVYAKNQGAVAAPTAGLHFTDELIKKIKEKGADFAELTLYVGYGTFSPVECDDIREHNIHTEDYFIEDFQAEKINRAVKEGKRIIAVGTTSVRTLEFAADEKGFVKSGKGKCNLYIYPGYEFKIVKAMVTNFHLPKSTLLMLISAFSDLGTIQKAYKEAVEKRYRFYSYGDAMFIE